MNVNDYQKAVLRTANTKITKYEAITNCALGIAGEGGEVADLVKKFVFHQHDLPKDKLEKELGDVLFYVAWMADCLGLNLNQVMEANVAKLKRRYPEGFSSEASLNRVE